MLLLLAIFFGCVACDDSDNEINIQPEATGSYTDVRDGNEYHWVRYAGLEWMTENLRFIPDKGVFAPDLTPLPGGYYNDKKNAEYYKKFGGLYDYEAALAAVPEGWRLPTDDDWLNLEKALGMSISDLKQSGERGNVQGELLQQGVDGTGINLQLSGYLIPDDRVMRCTLSKVCMVFTGRQRLMSPSREVIRFIIDRLFIILQKLYGIV